MIVGGNHLEWPSDAHYMDSDIHYMEDTMEEYEDWLWEQVGDPPQDDDIRWIKAQAFRAGADVGIEMAIFCMPSAEAIEKEVDQAVEVALIELWRTL